MKITSLAIVASICLALVSCGEGTTSPKVFNDTAISAFQEATKVLDSFDAKITEHINDGTPSAIGEDADAALAEVDKQRGRVEALNNPKGEEYKQAVLKSLDTVKDIVETGKQYSDLPEGYSWAEFDAIRKVYNDKRSELSANLQEVAAAQVEFVKNVSAN
ncbi:MAG: hypothetical protein LUD76_12535 [Alistipes sp.]|nr:hypothetical protein [Alistipes sp.]